MAYVGKDVAAVAVVVARMALEMALEKFLDFALGHEVHGPVVF